MARRSKDDEHSRSASLRYVAVATDLSPAARSAIARTAHLPLLPGAQVSVIHALPVAGRGAKKLAAAAQEKLDAEAAKLRDSIEQSGRPDIVVRGVLGRGAAAAEVARLAHDAKAEVVVVGRRGAGRMRELLLGTTAEHIAQLATMPVVIAGGSPTRPYQRPLVAVDGTPGSRSLIDAAFRVIDPGCQRVRVVTAYSVFGEGWLWAGGTPTAEMKWLRARAKDEAEKSLRRAMKDAGRLGTRLKVVLREGDARSVIAGDVRTYKPDLLVLGTQTKPGIGPIRLGRVAAYLLRVLSCDLLVVPTGHLEPER